MQVFFYFPIKYMVCDEHVSLTSMSFLVIFWRMCKFRSNLFLPPKRPMWKWLVNIWPITIYFLYGSYYVLSYYAYELCNYLTYNRQEQPRQSARLQINRSSAWSCIWGMIHTKNHFIIPGCPRPSISLQFRIVAYNNFLIT